jgi:hypothetical protein
MTTNNNNGNDKMDNGNSRFLRDEKSDQWLRASIEGGY